MVNWCRGLLYSFAAAASADCGLRLVRMMRRPEAAKALAIASPIGGGRRRSPGRLCAWGVLRLIVRPRMVVSGRAAAMGGA